MLNSVTIVCSTCWAAFTIFIIRHLPGCVTVREGSDGLRPLINPERLREDQPAPLFLTVCVCDVPPSTGSRFDVPLKRPRRHQTSHSETESGTRGTLRTFIIRLWCHSPDSKPSPHWIKKQRKTRQLQKSLGGGTENGERLGGMGWDGGGGGGWGGGCT